MILVLLDFVGGVLCGAPVESILLVCLADGDDVDVPKFEMFENEVLGD